MLRLPLGGSSRTAGEGEGVNDRASRKIRLRIIVRRAPISVCYKPMDGRFMNRPYKWSEVPAPFQRLPTHIRFKITIRPWRIISRFPQGKHITFSKKIYHVCHAHISLCRRHLPPSSTDKTSAPIARGESYRMCLRHNIYAPIFFFQFVFSRNHFSKRMFCFIIVSVNPPWR